MVNVRAIDFGVAVLRSVLKTPLGFACMLIKNRKGKGENSNDICTRYASFTATTFLEIMSSHNNLKTGSINHWMIPSILLQTDV